jgi:secreted PhoX family phosphatase
VWLAEDGGGIQRIQGITPDGETYTFARNRLVGADEEGTASEFAGPTFSPDGQTFFVNIQNPGHTFAITGPFPTRNPAGARRLAAADPTHPWAPKVSRRHREYAEKNGMSTSEVAAYVSLGVPLG